MSATGLVPQEHVVFTEFDGGEGVLVDLNTKKYFQLNETAVVVWRGLEDRLSLEEIIGRITSAYEVDDEHAAESVRRALENFRELGLAQNST
jgi:hypothetical protein